MARWLIFLFLISVSGVSQAKTARFPFGESFRHAESDNFRLHWHPQFDLDEGVANGMLEALETSFDTFHQALFLPLPQGADAHLVNVFISNAQYPPEVEMGAYMETDALGIAHLVVHEGLLTADDPGLTMVLAHEYFHAVQWATGAYAAFPTNGPHPADWYLEATATWAAIQAFPDDPVPYGDLLPYLRATEQALFLSSFEVPASSPHLGHEYGAFLFPLHLSLKFGPEIIADSFLLAADEQDPLRVLDRLLPEANIENAFMDFAVRNAVWDYPEPVLGFIVDWLDVFGLDDAALSVVLIDGDWVGTMDPAPQRPLHGFGYHLIQFQPAGDNGLKVAIKPPEEGSFGSTPALLARWVSGESNMAASTRFTSVGGALQLDLAASDFESGFLVVASVSDTRRSDEVFPYVLEVDIASPQAAADAAGSSAVGCHSLGAGPAPHLPWFTLFAILILRPFSRRRGRRDRRSQVLSRRTRG
jgi:hypothetical protein